MTDWDSGALVAIVRLQSKSAQFPIKNSLPMIDFLATKGFAHRQQLLSYGSKYFVQMVLGQVTYAIHGGGHIPKIGGWYSFKYSYIYLVDPDFSEAWIRARRAVE